MSEKSVLDYLEKSNRPHSFNDLQSTLKITKTTLQTSLEELLEQNLIREKIYGKQKIYFPCQKGTLTKKEANEQILALDRQINEINSNLEQSCNKIKSYLAKLEECKGKITYEEACEKKAGLEVEFRQLQDALKEFDGVEPVKPEVKSKLNAEHDKYLGEYKKRKRLCLEMLGAILENYPKTKKHLYEEIGIETDEDAGFSLEKI